MSNSVPTTQAMSHATMQMQKQNMELVHNEVKALGKSGLSQEEKSKKLREQCEGFESIFIQKMWQQMRATLPQENPLVGREEKFWQGMYDTELSKEMAKGGGIGLADMMYDQLSQNLVSASRTAAMQSAGSGGIALERGLRFSGAQNAASSSLAAAAAAPNASPNAKNADSGFSPEQFMPSPLAGILAEHKQDAKSAPKDLLAPQEGTSQRALASSAPHTFVAAGNKAPLYENLDGAALGTGLSNSGQNIGQNTGQGAGNQTHFINSANNPNALATMTGQGQNSALAQQFLSNLQAKQSANGQPVGQLTGPQRAAQAQYAVGSPPPANGVLPAGQLQQGAHVVRTTYTTNVPAGQRKADKQRLVENAMREAQQKRNKNTTVQGQPSPAQGYSVSAGQAGGMTFGVQAGMGQAGVGQVGNVQGQFQVSQPFAPIVPGQPHQPQQPLQPNQPGQLGQPTQPQQPQQPYQPQQPTQAVSPTQVGTHFVAPPAMVPTGGTAQGGTQRKS